MTREEIIHAMRKNTTCAFYDSDGYEDDINLMAEKEMDMVAKAVEKMIPIRPIMRIEEKGFNKGCIYPHCPICDTMPVPHPNVSYCDKCGQAIDWSELE